MKKLFFALACVIGLMTFTSCDPDLMGDLLEQKPEIELMEAEGHIWHNIGVRLGTELNFQVKVAPNSGSMSELTNVEFIVKNSEGTVLLSESGDIENPAGENIIEFSYEPTEASSYTCTFTVTDAANKSKEIKAIVVCSEPVEAVNGIYSGKLNINGYVTTNQIAGYEGYDHEEVSVTDVPVTLTLGEIDEEGNILVGVDVEDTYLALMGTVEEGTVTINGIYFFSAINLFVRVDVEFNVNIVGVIDEGVMTLSGTGTGAGEAQVLTAKLEVTFEDGTVEGTLEKVAE
jgi:hypothetical protein